MNKPLALALLVGGIILLVLGYNESHSLQSEGLRIWNGSPSNKSILMMVCGGVGVVLGLLGLSRSGK